MLQIIFLILSYAYCKQCSGITVGTWNVMQQPWLNEWTNIVNSRVVGSSIDVLHLVEVWTEEEAEKILNRQDVKNIFPYHYRPTTRNSQCGCKSDPTLLYMSSLFLQCMVDAGVNPRELIQPSTGPLPPTCMGIGIAIALYGNDNTNFLCLGCLINTAQLYPSGSFDVNSVVSTCASGAGPLYSYKGNSGHLILSKYPIQNVEEQLLNAWLSNRINVHATIKGIKLAFGHFAYNLLEDVYPPASPFMYGDTQVQQSQAMMVKQPDVIVGDLNTGTNYQPTAYNLLLTEYTSTFREQTNTYCPDSHVNFSLCVGAIPQAIDHILVRKLRPINHSTATTFNVRPLMSDHIGVKARVCVEE